MPDKLGDPLWWPSPRMIFFNSKSDLFYEGVPDEYIERVIRIMAVASWHTFQVLTKRSERLLSLLSGRLRFAATLPHVWWGVSVDTRRHGSPRIDQLRRAQAAVRFLSIEPLLEDLGSFDLSGIDWVIVGGESGPGARAMDPAWVRSIRDQCATNGVPFFFKQWGGARKSTTGRELDGRTYDEFPRRTEAAAPTISTRRRLQRELSLA